MMKRLFYYLLASVMLVVLVLSGRGVEPAVAQEERPEVYVAEVDGEISGETTEYLQRVISDAEAADAAAVAIKLDTPGGALGATKEIVQAESNAEVPVITYVAPRGGEAASAGSIIVMGSDVAAMSPETAIGATTPVNFFGQDITGDMGNKVMNNTVSLITAQARAHDRNAEWAESAVRDAASATADEALDLGVVEYVEPDLRDVLQKVDGETVEQKDITLDTANAVLVQQNRSFEERFGFSPYLAAGVGALVLIALLGATLAAVRATRQRASTGSEGMVGKIGEVRQRVTGDSPGLIFVHGERWRALPESPKLPPLEPGTEVEVVALRRGSVIVKPLEE